MSYLYFLFLPPVIGAIAFKVLWHRQVNFAEMMANMVVASILVCIVYFAGLYSEMADTQILNGKVTSKQKERVSCSHSYPCNCTPTPCGKSTCSTCDTCYDHSHDFDWNADTTIGEFTIDRVDRQGVKEPPRWTTIKAGDPVSRTDAYVNYIKASPDSLFTFSRQLVNDFKGAIPDYPAAVYDYYKVNRVIADGVSIDSGKWNSALSEALKDVGPAKQVNAVVLLTKRPDRLYASAVRSAWLGGKKNDVVVVVGAPDGKSI